MLCGAVLLTVAMTGCGDHKLSPSMAGPAYPFQQHTTDTVAVQVFRDGTQITIVNATATAWGPSRLWLNQRFSRTISGLAAGETRSFDLHTFWDEDGESFPAGGFMSSRQDMPVRLVEIDQGDSAMVGFVSIPRRSELDFNSDR